MKQLDQLRALGAKLRHSGNVKITSTASGVAGMSEHRLTYQTGGDVPIYWPITGAADISLSYSETDQTWECVGSMFGVAPRAQDPRTFFSLVYQGTRTREQTLRGFLQQTMQVAERYTGDLSQMMYRLGVQMAAVGTMVESKEFWQWTPSADPGVVVYFSPSAEPPQWLELPKAYIGFNPDVSMHKWEITQQNLLMIREQLKTYAHQAQAYCGDLNNCFA